MKLATHRTTTVPRKGPTIVQNYKKKLEGIAKVAAQNEKARRLAQALQGPQLPAPKDFQVELMHTKPTKCWNALNAFFNPRFNPKS